MEVFVARDSTKVLHIFNHKPIRFHGRWIDMNGCNELSIVNDDLPEGMDISWHNKPVRVKLKLEVL